MNHHGLAFVACIGLIGGIVAVNGCAFNPFSPPDFSESPPFSSSSAVISSGGGIGGSSEHGGSSGEGGAGGSGGAPCTCVDDGNDCTTDLPIETLCPDGDQAKCHTINLDEACSTGWCSDKGECRDCKTCTAAGTCANRCDGTACAAATDCKSGLCEQNFCCNEVCAGPCKACDRSGVEGKCTRMPLGLVCGEMEVCNVSGACVPQVIAALGASCNEASQCTSGVCRGNYCRSRIGEPCIEDIECTSNYCHPTTKTCQSCTLQSAICPGGGMCLTNLPNDSKDDVCQVLAGQPAPTDAECIAPAKRSAHMCKLPEGYKCERHGECQSHHCNAGKCDANCMIDAHCPSGTKCESINKVCTLLPGEYCIEAMFCASGICSGFPRRCQP